MPVIRKVTLTSERLAKLNQAHRNWILFFGHIANEMSFLTKLLLWSNPSDSQSQPSDPSTMGRAAQSMMLARLLIGKQWEAYQVMADSYFSNPVRNALESGLDVSSVEAGNRIASKFSNPESIYQIVRNRFAFHYSFNEFGKNFSRARRAEGLHLIFANGRQNVLYDASEVVVNRALLARIDADLPTATETFIQAAIDAAQWFGNYCDNVIANALIRAWGEPDTWGITSTAVDAQAFDKVDIPWFTND